MDQVTDSKAEQVYCEFHKSSGHSTDECWQLQSLLLARIKKGDLDIEPNRRQTPPRNEDRRANNDNCDSRDDRRWPNKLDCQDEHSHSDERQEHPKHRFPLSNINQIVEANAGNKLLSFMDVFFGYNQILMHKNDCKKTTFIMDQGTYF